MSDQAHVIVVGNEKGGAGKSTVAMHLIVGLLRMGYSVGALDLDLRQQTLMRYLTNRAKWKERHGSAIPMPAAYLFDASQAQDIARAEAENKAHLDTLLAQLAGEVDFVVIDSPGSDSFISRYAHARADTIITPLNDSFVDFDLLGDVDPQTFEVRRPSIYSEMVWESRKQKARDEKKPVDWIVMRNRMSPLDARNKRRVGGGLKALARKIGFRVAPGLSERVIYRELFPLGLTLLDVSDAGDEIGMTMGHVAARQELRDMVAVLKLPRLQGKELTF